MKIPMAVSFPWQRCTTVQPASLAKLPESWTKDEVGVWLRWCTEEYSIDPIPLDKFDLNGKALCLLSRNDFMERVPKNGDVLYNSLNSLLSKHGRKSQHQPGIGAALDWFTHASTPGVISDQSPSRYLLVPPTSPLSSTVAKSPSNVPCIPSYSTPVPIQSHSYISVFTKHEEDHDLSSVSRPSSSHIGSSAFTRPSSALEDMRPEHMNLDVLRQDRSECRLLWEFIYQLLCHIKYNSLVCWEDKEEFVFRIINPTGLAELWGQQKNRTNMTYEKLSRALRYYYRMNIIKKVPGKRLTYRFLQPPMTIQKGQRGAKPHYKLNFESVNGPRADRDTQIASYSGSSYKASSKDDSSNASACEANLEEDLEEDDEPEGDHSLHDPEIEAWVDQSNEQLTVSSQVSPSSSSDLEKKMSITQSHPSSIFPYPRSLYMDNRMNNTNLLLHSGLGPGFHYNRQVLNPHDPFYLTASTSHIGQNHPYKHQSGTRSTIASNTDIDSKTKEMVGKEDSAEHYWHRNVTSGNSLLRSRSYDFAQSFQAQQFSFRPNTAQSLSPQSVTQVEPEDLSTKGRPPSELETSTTPSADSPHVKTEMRASPESPKVDHQ